MNIVMLKTTNSRVLVIGLSIPHAILLNVCEAFIDSSGVYAMG